MMAGRPKPSLSPCHPVTLSRIGGSMARPVILYTGQWTDLPLEELAQKAGEWGYQGLELACWGDHFEVQRALSDEDYCQRKLELLGRHDLTTLALGCHRVGQAVCDPIDARHQKL